jgi:hypothetical protein
MRLRPAHLLIPALALVSSAAAAQLVPGTREPESAAEAINDARMIVCTLAAAGRPMGGLNIPLIGGEGYAPVDRIPDPLARFVESAPQQKVLEYPGAGGPLWIVYDPASGRCAIYAFTDAAPVEERLLQSLSRPRMWRRKNDAGPGIDHAFEWRPERGLVLRTEISLPDSAGEPIRIVVRRATR